MKRNDYANGTWIEPEEYCYPNGGMTRRARARDIKTGNLNTVWCGIPDTFFSVPCRGGGYVSINSDSGEIEYHPKIRKAD